MNNLNQFDLNLEYQEIDDFIKEKKAEKEESYRKLLDCLDQLPNYEESENLIRRLRASIEFYSIVSESVANIHSPRVDTSEPDCEEATKDKTVSVQLRPMEMLRPEYKEIYEQVGDLKHLIAMILPKFSPTADIETIAREIYAAPTEQDFDRAKDSLGSALNRGATKGMWRQVMRGRYAPNDDV